MRNQLTPKRRQFLKEWLKKSAYMFFGLWLFLAWAFQASYFASGLWAGFFTVFLCGGGMFLCWADGLADAEILKLLQQKNPAMTEENGHA